MSSNIVTLITNVFITILQHIENPGIVRTVYSSIFRDIQQYSAMVRLLRDIRIHGLDIKILGKALKYLDGVQRGQSYLMGRRCLFNCAWPPI